MNFSASIDGDLVAGTDGKTWVVVGSVVHETLACCRVGLLIEGARYGELGANRCLEVVLI